MKTIKINFTFGKKQVCSKEAWNKICFLAEEIKATDSFVHSLHYDADEKYFRLLDKLQQLEAKHEMLYEYIKRMQATRNWPTLIELYDGKTGQPSK